MEDQIRASIKTTFWSRLVRELTVDKVKETLADSKLSSTIPPTIFLPRSDESTLVQEHYYARAGEHVLSLPNKQKFKDDDFIQEISNIPGVLALQFDGNVPLKYIVPGGRFNEFYGWDSYFIAVGLIEDGQFDLARAIAHQFSFEIRNYGKILNANRPYYLGRTQPPFLTDLAWKLHDHSDIDVFVDWIKAAITEYQEVWASEPRYEPSTKLFRYYAQGFGIPPETEPGHFDAILLPFAQKHGLEIPEFIHQYNEKKIREPELDTYLLHDRSLRESGHDVSSRFVNCCADLVTIDLASLIYKYEVDIHRAVSKYPDHFRDVPSAEWWEDRAQSTKKAANDYLWNANAGVFCDFNVKKQEQHIPFVCAATFWALWSGLANESQAQSICVNGLAALEFKGGLSTSSKIKSSGRQWDYPAGWAPHQMLAWAGLTRYGFHSDARRIAQKWLATVTQGARQSGGALYEKYDITGVENPQDLNAEYGNQGNKDTGFGWTNSSFVIAYDKYSN